MRFQTVDLVRLARHERPDAVPDGLYAGVSDIGVEAAFMGGLGLQGTKITRIKKDGG